MIRTMSVPSALRWTAQAFVPNDVGVPPGRRTGTTTAAHAAAISLVHTDEPAEA